LVLICAFSKKPSTCGQILGIMQFPTGYKRAAAIIVLRHGQHFLLLKRNKPPFVGSYLPVGGKLEPFEDPYACALRELKEETGLELETLRYAGALIETSPIDYNWQCNIYVADIDFIAPPPCPEGDLEWIPFVEVPNVPTPPTDFILYQYLMAGRPFAFNALYDADLKLLKMTEEISGEVVVGRAAW
jgi:8-oxo-dGTP diphosphatase